MISLALLRQETFLILNSSWEKLTKGSLSVKPQDNEISAITVENIPHHTPIVFIQSWPSRFNISLTVIDTTIMETSYQKAFLIYSFWKFMFF